MHPKRNLEEESAVSNGVFLELKDITKRYPSPSGTPVTVLDRLSLRAGRGEAIAVVGPSGSGKSTLLNIIGSLDRPTEGSVILAGSDLNALNERAIAQLRNQTIGFVFQLHHLLPQCTVLENVLIPAIPRKDKNDKALLERAEMLLDRVGIGRLADYFPAQLSGGERQRTAVVRALINEPGLILADEPTGSLDQDSAEALGELLLELNREEHTTLIVVTHSNALAAKMDTVYRIENGGLVCA